MQLSPAELTQQSTALVGGAAAKQAAAPGHNIPARSSGQLQPGTEHSSDWAMKGQKSQEKEAERSLPIQTEAYKQKQQSRV